MVIGCRQKNNKIVKKILALLCIVSLIMSGMMSAVQAAVVTNIAVGAGYDTYSGGRAGDGITYTYGIDVSKWQGSGFNFQNIKNHGYTFAIIRCGVGSKIDPCFEEYYANAKAAGLDVGTYYYSKATNAAEAAAEADQCMKFIAGKKFEYPIYFDFEDPSAESKNAALAKDICLAFLDKLAANNYLTGIYGGATWLDEDSHGWVPTAEICKKYECWVARYYDSDGSAMDPKYSKRYGMYQFTSTNYIGGVGPLDTSRAYKDYPSIVKKHGFNGYSSINNPISWLDSLQGGTETVSVSGWCYDEDNLSKSLDVEVYIGGEKGSATAERHVVKADKYRGDVHALLKCGEYHGFSSVIATNKVGKQPVYVYAVNIGSGTDQLMGGNVVTIAANPVAGDSFEYNGNRYTYYSTEYLSWDEAQEFCKSNGGYLATFTTEDEWNSVSANLLLPRNYPNVWFGGYYPLPDSGEKEARTWVTGEKWTDWGDMLYDIEDDSYYMGTWNNGSRYGWSYYKSVSPSIKGFICEQDGPSKLSETEYNNSIYTYYDISGYRYRTWEEAEGFCKSLGGHLATFTTEDEWNYVNENLLKPQNSPNAWFGGYYPLPNSGEEEARTWVTGEKWTDWGDMLYDVEDDCYYMGTWNNGSRYGWSYYKNNSRTVTGIICEREKPYEVTRTKYKGNTYVYIDSSEFRHMSWSEAEAYCQAMGGHLATITTDNEWTAVNDNLLKPLNNPNVWLGGKLTGDTLRWVTEEKYKVLGNVEFVDLTDGCNYLGTWTTASGVYGLSYYGENSYSIDGFICEIESDVLMGDVNGDGVVSINDVTDIQKHIAELITLTDKQLAVADVDDSGDVDITDATRLQLIIAEIIR